MIMWQKCPVCNGSKLMPDISDWNRKCGVCKGQGIINVATGKPPESAETLGQVPLQQPMPMQPPPPWRPVAMANVCSHGVVGPCEKCYDANGSSK